MKIQLKLFHYRTRRDFMATRCWEFIENRHIKMIKFSALCTSRLYPLDVPMVLISVTGWIDPRTIVRPEELRQWKIPVTPSERVHVLSACSAVPQEQRQGVFRHNLVTYICRIPNLEVQLSNKPQKFVRPPCFRYNLSKMNIYGFGVAANGLKHTQDLMNILQIAEEWNGGNTQRQATQGLLWICEPRFLVQNGKEATS